MSTTQTTPGDGTTESSSGSARWSDLPDDLLGNIHVRIATLHDHVRLAAVCRSWRAAVARLPAPPAVPVLLLSPCSNRSSGRKHLCGPDYAWVTRVPTKAENKLFIGSHDGGWVAAFDNRELTLVNLFSGAEMPVRPLRPGRLRQNPIAKIIFSDAPTSSNGCILAAITDDRLKIALCKVSKGSASGWTITTWHKKMFADIAFCDGDLYGLTYPDENLVKFKLNTKGEGKPVITSTHQLAVRRRRGPTMKDDPSSYGCCMVELNGEPLMAIRTRWLPDREPFFKVFMLVDANPSDVYWYKWAEVKSFGEYVLFLGQIRSKVVHVPVGVERRGLVRNRIYYLKSTSSREHELRGNEVYTVSLECDDHLCCREDQSIGDGLERTGYYMMGWDYVSMWVHPPEL